MPKTTKPARTLSEILVELHSPDRTHHAETLIREADANAYARGLAASRASPEEGRLPVALLEHARLLMLRDAHEHALMADDRLHVAGWLMLLDEAIRDVKLSDLRSPPAPSEETREPCPTCNASIETGPAGHGAGCPVRVAPPPEDSGAREVSGWMLKSDARALGLSCWGAVRVHRERPVSNAIIDAAVRVRVIVDRAPASSKEGERWE